MQRTLTNMPWAVVLTIVMALGGVAVWAAGEAKQVGVLWAQKSGRAEVISKAMAERLKEKAPQITVEFKINLKDDEEAGKVYDNFQESKNAVVFLRSEGATYMGKNPPKVPGFIGAANNPVLLGVMKDMTKPENNFTGVTYYLPVQAQIELCRKLWPELKSVCLLVKKGHPAAAIEQAETKAACAALGLTYAEAVCETKEELATAVAKSKATTGVFIMGGQNLIFDNAPLIAKLAGNVPVMSLSANAIGKGALGGLVADEEKLGRVLADQIIAVLVEGKKVSEVPVAVDTDPKFMYDPERAKALGVNIPDDLAAKAVKVGQDK